MTSIALCAPTMLKLSPGKLAGHPLAGAEQSLLHLRLALEKLGHKVVCFTNLDGSSQNASLCADTDFREQDFELVIYSRTYGRDLGASVAATRRILWLHDTVEESASLVAGGIAAIGKSLDQYHHLVFVSAWHRMQYATRFPKATDWLTKTSSIWHLLPEISALRGESSRFDVIHTAHPRKALAAVLDIYDMLAAKRPSLRLALVDSAEIYQDRWFVFEGRRTSLSAVLKARYGKAGPPFEVLPAMSQCELFLLLAQCEVLLHPDQSTETGATTVLEAIQAGCATVVSDLGCLPEMASTTGSVYPAPGIVALQVYANAVCVALDQCETRRRWDVGQNVRNHNSAQSSRWAHALAAASGTAPEASCIEGSRCRDVNGLLVAHPRKQTLAMAVPGSQNFQLAVHVFPQRDLALLGVLEPTALPDIHGDVDALASAFSKTMNELIKRLAAQGISSLIMRVSPRTVPSAVVKAWLCAAAAHGARFMTIRQLSIALSDTQNDELRERVTLSTRVREQVEAARANWTIRHLSGSSSDFNAWFNAYDKHRSSYGAIGLVRERARKLINSDGELGVHGAIAIDPVSEEVCGFYLILREGEFATLHSWGTVRRYRSNLHKLLIADSARLARMHGVRQYEYGSDLSEYGKNEGLNSLYRRFGGAVSPSLQLIFPIPTAHVTYAPT
jgi:hypothetical protein